MRSGARVPGRVRAAHVSLLDVRFETYEASPCLADFEAEIRFTVASIVVLRPRDLITF